MGMEERCTDKGVCVCARACSCVYVGCGAGEMAQQLRDLAAPLV